MIITLLNLKLATDLYKIKFLKTDSPGIHPYS